MKGQYDRKEGKIKYNNSIKISQIVLTSEEIDGYMNENIVKTNINQKAENAIFSLILLSAK